MKWRVTSNIKLITFLHEKLPSYSARAIKKKIESNACKVNKEVERFASTQLVKGDWVEFNLSIFSKTLYTETTIYEDEEYKIIDKPPYTSCEEKVFKPYFLTHRLDRDTSGLLILAKHKDAEERMVTLFAKREVKKRYLAIVDGRVKRGEGVCQSRLRAKIRYQGGALWGSSKRGKMAVTRYKCLQKGKDSSLLLCQPETGRTHQIRVHLLEMGHPILGDYQYCSEFASQVEAKRQMLHAHTLFFIHPFLRKEVEVEAKVPEDFSPHLRWMKESCP